MGATIKTGMAILIAVFLLNPSGICAVMIQSTTAPAHQCCPVPTKTTLEQTICVCAASEAASLTIQPMIESGSLPVPEANVPLPEFDNESASILSAASPSLQSYVSLHQFRI